MASKNTLKLYITGDGSVAVKTFDEVGTASERTAEKVDDSAKKQSESFGVVEEGAGRLRSAIGMLAGTIGLGGLAFGIKDVIEAGEQWQQQESQLINALKNVGQYSAHTANMVRSAAESLSVHGGFAGPQEMAAMNQFVRLTGSATRAIQLNKDATELARGTTMGYAQAQQLVDQVLTGNVGRLQKYLGIIQPVKTAEFALTQAHGLNLAVLEEQSKALGKLGPAWLKNQEILHNITPTEMQHAQLLDRQATATIALQRIQERYGGSTQTFSKTTAGALSNLKNRFDLLGESVGRKVLPVVTALLGFIADHTTAVLILTGAITGLGVAVGIVDAVKSLGAAIVAFSGAEEGATIATIAWGTAMRLTVIGIVITALYLLVTHFKQVKAIAIDVFHWITTAASNAWTWIKTHWVLLAGILGGPIGLAVAFIISHLHAIEKAFEQAFKFIVNLPVLKQLIGAIGTIGHFLGSFGGHYTAPNGRTSGFTGAGSVLHKAAGGLVGGSGIGDIVPAMLEPGEYVLRKPAVQTVGVQTLNAINAGGSVAGAGGGGGDIYVAAPIKIQMGSRIAAETVAHFSAKKASLSGSYVSG